MKPVKMKQDIEAILLISVSSAYCAFFQFVYELPYGAGSHAPLDDASLQFREATGFFVLCIRLLFANRRIQSAIESQYEPQYQQMTPRAELMISAHHERR